MLESVILQHRIFILCINRNIIPRKTMNERIIEWKSQYSLFLVKETSQFRNNHLHRTYVWPRNYFPDNNAS